MNCGGRLDCFQRVTRRKERGWTWVWPFWGRFLRLLSYVVSAVMGSGQWPVREVEIGDSAVVTSPILGDLSGDVTIYVSRPPC